MLRWTPVVLAACLAVQPAAAWAADFCKRETVTVLPVMRFSNIPLVEGVLNGQPVRMVIETSTARSFIWGEYADDIGLDVRPAAEQPEGPLTLPTARMTEVRIANLTWQVDALPVYGSGEQSYALVVGRDLLAQYDILFDLPNQEITLFKPTECGDLPPDSKRPVATVPLQPDGFRFSATVDGRPVTAELATGTPRSLVNADIDGARLQAASVIGPRGPSQVKIATFGDLAIGTLRFAEPKLIVDESQAGVPDPVNRPELVIGADFLQAHRVLLAAKDNRLHVMPTGGSVFGLEEAADDFRALVAPLEKLLRKDLRKQLGKDAPPIQAVAVPGALLPKPAR